MKEIKFEVIKQFHKIECPEVSLEFFMENYCKQLKYNSNYTQVHVIVSKNFKFVF